jgi:hypothetical protein
MIFGNFAGVVKGEMADLYPIEVPLTADSSSAVKMTEKQRALNSRKIDRNNTYTTFPSVLIFTDEILVYVSYFKKNESRLMILMTVCLSVCVPLVAISRSLFPALA